jgi:uncharacterized protein (DUF305 family)
MKQDMHDPKAKQGSQYVRLAAMVVLSFIAMYLFMYAMINNAANFYPNLNQFYMAGLMTAPMVVFEMLLMGKMYPRKQWNMWITVAGVLALGLFWLGIRKQAAIGDRQFLESMIPHHAGAILMCQQATITDADIERLCDEIVSSQQKEIAQMKAKLSELK